MLLRNSITTIALATALTTVLLAGAGARADDASKYPNWKGQWVGVGSRRGRGLGSGQARRGRAAGAFDAGISGHLSEDHGGPCQRREGSDHLPADRRHAADHDAVPADGDHRDAGHHLHPDQSQRVQRRIFTDGRDWPEEIEPAYAGYSIGKWIDERRQRALQRARGRDPRYSGVRAPTTPAGCRCISTIRAWSRSGCISTRPTPISCTTTSPSSTTL